MKTTLIYVKRTEREKRLRHQVHLQFHHQLRKAICLTAFNLRTPQLPHQDKINLYILFRALVFRTLTSIPFPFTGFFAENNRLFTKGWRVEMTGKNKRKEMQVIWKVHPSPRKVTFKYPSDLKHRA